jgi:hypothetical protein
MCPPEEVAAEESLTCPSAPAEVGARVLSIRGRDGVAQYVASELRVTPDFLEALSAVPNVDGRFRFASACISSACAQWQDGRCSVPSKSAATDVEPAGATDLPRCAIRASCRWFAQEGRAVCMTCPLITRTDGSSSPA